MSAHNKPLHFGTTTPHCNQRSRQLQRSRKEKPTASESMHGNAQTSKRLVLHQHRCLGKQTRHPAQRKSHEARTTLRLLAGWPFDFVLALADGRRRLPEAPTRVSHALKLRRTRRSSSSIITRLQRRDVVAVVHYHRQRSATTQRKPQRKATTLRKQQRKESNNAKKATTQRKQRRKESNDAKKATTQTKQRRKQSNDANKATTQITQTKQQQNKRRRRSVTKSQTRTHCDDVV